MTGTCGGALTGNVYKTAPAEADCSVGASFKVINAVRPGKPSLKAQTFNKSGGTLLISPADEGTYPVTSFTTECAVDDSIFRMSAKPKLVSMGRFNGSTSAIAWGTRAGNEFTPNADLFELSRGMVLRFRHDDSSSDEFVLRRVQRTDRGNHFVSSRVSPSHWLQLLVRPDGNFFGTIVTSGRTYQAYIQAGRTIIYSSQEGALARNPFVNDAIHDSGALIVPSGAVSASISDDPAVVTVGVLVDDLIASASRDDVYDYVDWLMSSANATYQDSGVDIALKVTSIIQHDPGGNNLTMHQRLLTVSCGAPNCSFGSGLNPVVTDWRLQDDVEADLVVQLVAVGSYESCGKGWIPYSMDLVADPLSLFFFTHSISAGGYLDQDSNWVMCPANVVAHEIGHNLGLWHDRTTLLGQGWQGAADLQQPPLPYGFGYKLSSGHGSNMSYPDSVVVPFDGYVPFLSNPNIRLNNEPLGTPLNQPNPAFAALSTQNLRSYYESILNSKNPSFAPLAPVLESSYTSTASSIALSFQSQGGVVEQQPDLYTANCSGVTASSSSSPIRVTGLEASATYSCTVIASNRFGTGPASNTVTVQTRADSFYTVTPNSEGGGVISPNNTQLVGEGDFAVFSVTPDTAYSIDSVTGCGGDLLGSTYVTAPITANCEVVATFFGAGDSHVVTPVQSVGSSVSPAEPQIVQHGQYATFSFTAKEGYRFAYNFKGTTCKLDTHRRNGGDLELTVGPVTAPCEVGAQYEPYWAVSGPSKTITLTGLPENKKIECRTFATSLAGNSPLSDAEYFVTRDPSLPSGVKIDRWDSGDEEIYLNVSVGSNGGANVSSYEATCTDGKSSYSAVSNSSSITVTGLQNDVPYTCTAAAINSAGRSDDSPKTTPIVPELLPTGLPIWLLYEASK